MSWTDERVELLKKMWAEGKSASQIAKELGSVTRNAVIGKVHRLGLSSRTAGDSEAAAAPAPQQPAETPEAPAAAAARPAAPPEPEAEPAPRVPPVTAEAPAPQPA
ncbi:GcrA cell cycle regulator, partial [Pararhodobacter marinus]